MNIIQEHELLRISFGSVKGIVQTISNRDGLTIVLYDSIFDMPVVCYLQNIPEDELRDILGKKVIVTGRIHRNPDTGQPTHIEDVTDITHLEAMGDYQSARGIFDWQDGDEPAEITIRRLRDGSD
ncbi:MAG: hypothetical protein KJ043_06390 [Anaerolineae bacterium]|nr:hypothetical protein [Anaerolineae bacterium]